MCVGFTKVLQRLILTKMQRKEVLTQSNIQNHQGTVIFVAQKGLIIVAKFLIHTHTRTAEMRCWRWYIAADDPGHYSRMPSYRSLQQGLVKLFTEAQFCFFKGNCLLNVFKGKTECEHAKSIFCEKFDTILLGQKQKIVTSPKRFGTLP